MVWGSCSWCHEVNNLCQRWCIKCGHAAHKPRCECDCVKCIGLLADEFRCADTPIVIEKPLPPEKEV